MHLHLEPDKNKCSLTHQCKSIRIGWHSCLVKLTNIHRYIQKHMHTYMHMYIHAIHSFRIQASSYVDTPTNVTEQNWNRVLQPTVTYVCGLDFIQIDLDHNRVWCVHNWVLTESTRINPGRGLVCQRYNIAVQMKDLTIWRRMGKKEFLKMSYTTEIATSIGC